MIGALPLVGSAIAALSPMITTPGANAATAATQATQGQNFGQVVAQFAHQTIDDLKSAEKMSADGIQGKQGVQSVVEAVMSAQESLQTAIAIRDKAVTAFQEVSRMAI